MRIVVTPDDVEVVAPESTTPGEIRAFVERKRKWIYVKREEVQERAGRFLDIHPSQLVSGAKIPYKGRRMPLTVQRRQGHEVDIQYRNGFIVRCAAKTPATSKPLIPGGSSSTTKRAKISSLVSKALPP